MYAACNHVLKFTWHIYVKYQKLVWFCTYNFIFAFVMFATHISLHLKPMQCSWRTFSFISNLGNVRDAHSFPFKMFVMFTTHNLFYSKCSSCSLHAFILYCTLHLAITITYCAYVYNEVLSCIFEINKKKIET